MNVTTMAEWLATYALHSSVALGVVWYVTAHSRLRFWPDVREFLWKFGALAPLVTATVQFLLGVGWFAFAAPIGTVNDASDGVVALEGSADSRAARVAVEARRSESIPERTLDVAWVEPIENTSDRSRSGITLAGILVALWGIGAAAMAGSRLLRKRSLLKRLRHRRAIASPRVCALLDEVRNALDVSWPVRLSASSALPAPVVLGASEVCVPERAVEELSETEWFGLLGHEMAHVRRRDPWWLETMGWLQALFYFQPLNRLAAREVRFAAEEQCDDLVVLLLDGGRALARCLVRVGGWLTSKSATVPFPAMTSVRSNLARRLARLSTVESDLQRRRRMGVPERVATGVILLFALVFIAPGCNYEDQAQAVTPAAQGSGLSSSRAVATGLALDSAPGRGKTYANAAAKPIESPPTTTGQDAYAAFVTDARDAADQAANLATRGGDEENIRHNLMLLLDSVEPGLYVHLAGMSEASRIIFARSAGAWVNLKTPTVSVSVGVPGSAERNLTVLAADAGETNGGDYVVRLPDRVFRTTVVFGDSIVVDRLRLDARQDVLVLTPGGAGLVPLQDTEGSALSGER